jgi:hypothetical protein
MQALSSDVAGGRERPEVVRADPRLRKQALVMVVVATALFTGAVEWLVPWTNQTIAQAMREGMPRSAVCKSALVVLSVFAVSVAGFGAYVIALGRRIASAQRFPLPGQAVIRDTRVVSGRVAVLFGRCQAFLGGTLIVLAASLFGLSCYGLARLMH